MIKATFEKNMSKNSVNFHIPLRPNSIILRQEWLTYQVILDKHENVK